MNYYSPELIGYIQETGTAAHQLTQKADIFALGLIYAEYLTGALSSFDADRYQYAGIAAQARRCCGCPPTFPLPSWSWSTRMLLADPTARPTIAETRTTLMGIRTPTTTTAVLTAPSPTRAPTIASRLKGRETRTATRGTPSSLAELRPARRLMGRLLERRQRPGHAMSTRWQCAVCEASNDGGDSCSVPMEPPSSNHPGPARPKAAGPQAPVQEQDDTSVPVRELPVREPASKIAYPRLAMTSMTTSSSRTRQLQRNATPSSKATRRGPESGSTAAACPSLGMLLAFWPPSRSSPTCSSQRLSA